MLAHQRAALSLLPTLLGLWAAAAEESRMYHGLWGGLLSQAAAPAPPVASVGVSGALHGALAELQSRLLARLAVGTDTSDTSGTDSSSAAGSVLSKLDGYLAERLNATLALLGRSDRSAGGAGGGGTASVPEAPLPPPGGANWSAAEALELAAQAWALGALAGGSGAAASGLALHAAASSLGGSGSSGSAVSGLEGPALVASPSWEAFRPLLCLRLQNLGNADGWSSALLGAAPCSRGSAAVGGDALRWRSSAAFLLDCSRRGAGGSAGDASGSAATGSPAGSGSSAGAAAASVAGALAGAGMAAAERVAASLAAAVGSRRTCRLAVGSTGGGAGAAASTAGSAAQLEYSFEQPLFAAPKMDALRLRVCNIPPTSLQFPAALARGASVSLASLKLNGRPLLPGPLAAPQAAATNGCLVRLYRLGSAAKGSFVLSGWLDLTEGGSSNDGGVGPMGAFGVGEMASLELTLGEYSLFDAATARLFPGSGAAAAVAAAQQPGGGAPVKP